MTKDILANKWVDVHTAAKFKVKSHKLDWNIAYDPNAVKCIVIIKSFAFLHMIPVETLRSVSL